MSDNLDMSDFLHTSELEKHPGARGLFSLKPEPKWVQDHLDTVASYGWELVSASAIATKDNTLHHFYWRRDDE